MSLPTLMTADELLHAHIPDKRAELVRGVLIVHEPAGSMHGLVAMNIGVELSVFAKRTGAGKVFAAETGFKLTSEPDTVRAPDVAFITRERVPPPETTGYAALAPDLVVEVLSPGTRRRDRVVKSKRYAHFGVREMWIADPDRKTIEVFVNAGEGFRREAVYSGEDVLRSPLLPGLEVPLDKVFAPI